MCRETEGLVRPVSLEESDLPLEAEGFLLLGHPFRRALNPLNKFLLLLFKDLLLSLGEEIITRVLELLAVDVGVSERFLINFEKKRMRVSHSEPKSN